MNHKHAEYIIAWAHGVEVEFWNECSDQWADVGEAHYWTPDWEYRFKPKMIRCGEMEFPEPMRVAPELDTRFWLATTLEDVLVYRWENDAFDQKVLSRGICHLTEEAAEAHARALIALTEVKP